MVSTHIKVTLQSVEFRNDKAEHSAQNKKKHFQSIHMNYYKKTTCFFICSSTVIPHISRKNIVFPVLYSTDYKCPYHYYWIDLLHEAGNYLEERSARAIC